MSFDLTNHTDWVYTDVTGKIIARGTDIDTLKAALPDSNVGYALFHITVAADNFDANIVLQWKGPSSSPMNKNKSNTGLQHALDVLVPNKGFVEVLGKSNLTVDNIYACSRPGSSSKVIQA